MQFRYKGIGIYEYQNIILKKEIVNLRYIVVFKMDILIFYFVMYGFVRVVFSRYLFLQVVLVCMLGQMNFFMNLDFILGIII